MARSSRDPSRTGALDPAMITRTRLSALRWGLGVQLEFGVRPHQPIPFTARYSGLLVPYWLRTAFLMAVILSRSPFSPSSYSPRIRCCFPSSASATVPDWEGDRGVAPAPSNRGWRSTHGAEHRLDIRLHRGIHLDERWPGAFEAFAGEFRGGVEALFAATGDFAGGVVEHVGRVHFFTNGLRTLSCGKAEKSRSADNSSLAP